RLSAFGALDFADDAETNVVTGIVRRVRGAGRGAQIGEARFPTAAAIHSLHARSRTTRVLFRRTCVGMGEIEAPFPDIAGHIFDGEETCAARKGADRRRYWVSVIDPHIAPRKRSAGI